MNIHEPKKIETATVVPGDSIQLLVDGKVVLTEQITETHTFDRAVVIEVGPEDGFDADYGLGGVFLEQKARG